MSNPEYLILFGLLFFLFGSYNLFKGARRIRDAYEQGVTLPWYRQTSLVIGLEYILLACVCLVRLSVVNKWLPQSVNVLVLPAYILIFIPAAIFAGLIVRQSILSVRQSRQSTAPAAVSASNASEIVQSKDDPQQRTVNQQHRRERRQKAAAARRKRAGRA